MKKQSLSILYIALMSCLASCYTRSQHLPKDGWNAATHQLPEKFKEIFHQNIYNAGPAGWMVELFQPSTWDLAVYVFCPNGRCNLADDLREFDGHWTLDKDTITVEFYQEVLSDGTTIACDWKEKAASRNQEKNNKKGSVLFIPREKFCWSEMVSSATGENKYPSKLLSLDASCD